MAKTIEELAKLASKNFNGEEFEKDIYGDGYKNGANVVLEEIEKVYQKEGAFGVMQLIKQLKEAL